MVRFAATTSGLIQSGKSDEVMMTADRITIVRRGEIAYYLIIDKNLTFGSFLIDGRPNKAYAKGVRAHRRTKEELTNNSSMLC